jgi:phage anti-repressor protein
MDYKKNLIDAYKKLDRAVEIFVENGGTPDDRPQLQTELEWRLRQLEAPPKEAMVGDVKVWSDGRWFNDAYHSVSDIRGYLHVVHKTQNMPIDNYYGAFHLWMRDHFLPDETMAISHICGEKRTVTHHISENKTDNNVANLIKIPSNLHKIYHPFTVSMPASDVALEFITRYGDGKSLTSTTAEKPAEPEMVDMRWLHGALGVSRRYNDWINQWHNKIGFTLTGVKPPIAVGGRPSQDYSIPVRDALKIAMATKTATAETVRDGLIDKLQAAQRLAVAVAKPDYRAALRTARHEIPEVMAGIEIAFTKQMAQLAAAEAELGRWRELVGDGGYISKRAVRRLKRDVAVIEG